MTSDPFKNIPKELTGILLLVSGTLLAEVLLHQVEKRKASPDYRSDIEQNEYEEMLGI